MFRKKSGMFLLQNVIHLIFICGTFRSFGLILKFTWFFNKVLSNTCCKKRKIERLQAFKTCLGMWEIMSNCMLAQSLVLIRKYYEIKNLGNSKKCRQNKRVCDTLWLRSGICMMQISCRNRTWELRSKQDSLRWSKNSLIWKWYEIIQ